MPDSAARPPIRGAARHERATGATARPLARGPLSRSVAIPCAYFDAGFCRSCSLLDVAYSDQLAGKQERARELIDPFAHVETGGIEWLAAAASETSGFRTKVKLVVGGTTDAPTLGILDAQQRGVDLEDCPIVAEPIRAVLPRLAAFITTARLMPYDVAARRGELKYLIVTANARGELMLRFVLRSTESVLRIRKHLPALRADLPQLRVATVNLLPEHKAVLEGEEEIALTDETALELPFSLAFAGSAAGTAPAPPAGELALRLVPRSFVQTNESVASRLYRAGADWAAAVAPSSVWDLYCGVGGFALHLVARLRWSRSEHGVTSGAHVAATRVTGVEVSADAVASATAAAEAGGLDASFIAADATSWAQRQESAPELVVVNPPRRGIGPELAGWLESSGVRHVLYSSCNAETLARDLAAMPSLAPVRAQVFDMFPHTAHFETLVLLERA